MCRRSVAFICMCVYFLIILISCYWILFRYPSCVCIIYSTSNRSISQQWQHRKKNYNWMQWFRLIECRLINFISSVTFYHMNISFSPIRTRLLLGDHFIVQQFVCESKENQLKMPSKMLNLFEGNEHAINKIRTSSSRQMKFLADLALLPGQTLANEKCSFFLLPARDSHRVDEL